MDTITVPPSPLAAQQALSSLLRESFCSVLTTPRTTPSREYGGDDNPIVLSESEDDGVDDRGVGDGRSQFLSAVMRTLGSKGVRAGSRPWSGPGRGRMDPRDAPFHLGSREDDDRAVSEPESNAGGLSGRSGPYTQGYCPSWDHPRTNSGGRLSGSEGRQTDRREPPDVGLDTAALDPKGDPPCQFIIDDGRLQLGERAAKRKGRELRGVCGYGQSCDSTFAVEMSLEHSGRPSDHLYSV